nr:unnamed protein product [Callosobruchus analis]
MNKSGSNVSLSSLPPLSIDKDIPDMTSVSKTGLQRDMIKFEDTLTESERNSTFALLQEHRDCISLSLKDLGRTSTEEMHIRCSTDEPIVTSDVLRPERIPRMAECKQPMVQQRYILTVM